MTKCDFLLVDVGEQGVLLASDILAEVSFRHPQFEFAVHFVIMELSARRWCQDAGILLLVGRVLPHPSPLRQALRQSQDTTQLNPAVLSFSACSAADSSSMNWSILPSSTSSRRWLVKPMRWSVTRFWGKL